MDNRVRAFWDTYWEGQGPTTMARTMTQILDRIKLEHLQAILPPNGRTLEVGCGSGRLSCYLARQGLRTVCLDFSLPALDAARRNYAAAGVPGRFVAGDGFGLPFGDGVFAVLLSTGLLEHFEDPLPIVREMVRVLRPGGLFYSDIVPRKFSLFRSMDWAARVRRAWVGEGEPSDTFFERSFTRAEIHDLLGRAGLVGIEVFPAGVVPPYAPILYRSQRLREAQVRLVERTRRFWKRLDGTRLAEWLGFYYFAWATKP